MLIFGLMTWIVAIIVMIYQTLLDFKTGMLSRKLTHFGIALTGIAFAAADSIITRDIEPLVLSLVTGITAYYFFKYTIYRTGLIGGGDVRVMYSLGFMFPMLSGVPFIINENFLFGIKETWPYLSMYFNFVIIAGFFIIFETLVDCWRYNKINAANPDIKYLAASLLFFAISAVAAIIPKSAGATLSVGIIFNFNRIVHGLIVISLLIIGLFSLKRFSKDILRKKLKFRELPPVGHQILSSQYVVKLNNGAGSKTEIKAVADEEIRELKRQMKTKAKDKGGKGLYDIIVQKNTIIPLEIARKLAYLAPDAEIEIKTAKPRTIYLLIMVLLLPLGDLFTIMEKFIAG